MGSDWLLRISAPGLSGHLCARVPASGPAAVEVILAGPALGEGTVVVRDRALPRPAPGSSAIRGEGLWLEAVCETPGEHWSFGLEAFGLRVECAPEVVGTLSDDELRGERIPVGADLEWEADGQVHGEVMVGTRRVDVAGTGELTVADAAPR